MSSVKIGMVHIWVGTVYVLTQLLLCNKLTVTLWVSCPKWTWHIHTSHYSRWTSADTEWFGHQGLASSQCLKSSLAEVISAPSGVICAKIWPLLPTIYFRFTTPSLGYKADTGQDRYQHASAVPPILANFALNTFIPTWNFYITNFAFILFFFFFACWSCCRSRHAKLMLLQKEKDC